MRIPKGAEPQLRGSYTVRYSQTDRNRHLHNTCYPDLLLDFLPDVEHRYQTSLSLCFRRDAPLGETFDVYCIDEGEVAYLFTRLPSGEVGVEMQVSLRPVDDLAL